MFTVNNIKCAGVKCRRWLESCQSPKLTKVIHHTCDLMTPQPYTRCRWRQAGVASITLCCQDLLGVANISLCSLFRAHCLDARSLTQYGVYLPRCNPLGWFVLEQRLAEMADGSPGKSNTSGCSFILFYINILPPPFLACIWLLQISNVLVSSCLQAPKPGICMMTCDGNDSWNDVLGISVVTCDGNDV